MNRIFHRTYPLLMVLVLVILTTSAAAQTGDQRNKTPAEISETLSGEQEVPIDTASSRGETALPFGGGTGINLVALLGKMIGYFILIVFLILDLVYILKKFVFGRKELFGDNKAVRVLSSTYVAPKKSLMIVEVLDRLLILSVTDNNMNLVTELKPEEYAAFIDRKNDRKAESSPARGQFGTVLNRLLNRPK